MGLDVQAKERANEIAVRDPQTELTWAELNSLLNRAVGALRRTAGDDAAPAVAIYGENAVETLVMHVAALFAGVAPIPVNRALAHDEARYILGDSGARAVFVGPGTAAAGSRAAAEAGIDLVVGWRTTQPGVRRWETWLDQGADEEPALDVPARPTMHYTSGTTGRPKGVQMRAAIGDLDVAGYVQYLLAVATGLGLAGRPHLVVGPLHHTAPLGSVWALASGAPVTIMERFDPEATLAAIEEHRIATSIMVPTHLVRLLKLAPETRARYDVTSLENVIITGAACPVDVKRAVIDWWGPIVTEGYGGTEAGIVTVITANEWLEHPGSVGRCTPDFEPVAVGPDGEELPAGEVGVLYFKDRTGKGISYRNDPEKTREAHRAPGVFTIGDVGYVDDDGYLYITDRAIDMIVSGGTNIYSAEVEAILLQHPAIRDAALIGVPNEELGEEPKALVEAVDPGDPPEVDEVIAFCRERIAHYKCPRSVEVVESVGRSAMGKVNKRELRARYWSGDRTIGG